MERCLTVFFVILNHKWYYCCIEPSALGQTLQGRALWSFVGHCPPSVYLTCDKISQAFTLHVFAYCQHQKPEVVKSWKRGYGSINTLAQRRWSRVMTGALLLWFICPQYLTSKWVPRSQNNNGNWNFAFLPLEELCWSTLERESSKDCPQSGAWRKGERQLHSVSYFVLWEPYIVTIGHDSCF